MKNRLKEMGQSAAWHLMVRGAIKGAEQAGYLLKRQPGRGLSNTYEVTKDGKTKVASVRTTQDRWIAFPPLDKGTRWKTLDDVELVLVSAVDNRENPQNVDVYLFPADEVRKRFDASYAARIKQGHTVRDDYGMWVMLDKGDNEVPSQVGHSLALDYPAIARFSIDELLRPRWRSGPAIRTRMRRSSLWTWATRLRMTCSPLPTCWRSPGRRSRRCPACLPRRSTSISRWACRVRGQEGGGRRAVALDARSVLNPARADCNEQQEQGEIGRKTPQRHAALPRHSRSVRYR